MKKGSNFSAYLGPAIPLVSNPFCVGVRKEMGVVNTGARRVASLHSRGSSSADIHTRGYAQPAMRCFPLLSLLWTDFLYALQPCCVRGPFHAPAHSVDDPDHARHTLYKERYPLSLYVMPCLETPEIP
jgi:hypothetical protein